MLCKIFEASQSNECSILELHQILKIMPHLSLLPVRILDFEAVLYILFITGCKQWKPINLTNVLEGYS